VKPTPIIDVPVLWYYISALIRSVWHLNCVGSQGRDLYGAYGSTFYGDKACAAFILGRQHQHNSMSELHGEGFPVHMFPL
jgi:hypothetical protein